MKHYRLWDTKEKVFLNSVKYVSITQASEDKDSFLDDGNYANDPHTVIQIHEYNDSEFVRTMNF